MRESYQLLKIKKERVKVGSIKFSHKQISFGGVNFSSSFEPEYKSQNSSNAAQKGIEGTLSTLDLRWDLQTALLFAALIVLSFTYINFYFDLFMLNYIEAGLSPEFKHFGLKYLFEVAFNCNIISEVYSSPLRPLVPVLTDLSIQLNTLL